MPSVEVKNVDEAQLNNLKEKLSKFNPIKFSHTSGSDKRLVILRYRDGDAIPDFADLKKKNMLVSSAFPLKKPSLFIRNTKTMTEEQILALFDGKQMKSIRFVKNSPDGFIKMAVVNFEDESTALSAMNALTNVTIDGKKISVAYR